MRPIPRLTRWAMWRTDSDTTGDRLVTLACAVLLVLVMTGVIR